MDEQMHRTPDQPADEGTTATAVMEMPPSTAAHTMSDEQRLERLLKRLIRVLIGAVVVFSVIYFFGQRQSHVEQAVPIPDQAVASAEAKVRSNPNDITSRLQLASTYAQNQRVEDALVQLREVLKFAPKTKPALLGIGELEYARGNLASAKKVLETYVAMGSTGEFAAADPQLERAEYALGMVLLKQGDTKGAVEHLNAALKINSGDADAWNGLGLADLALKDYANAAAAFRRALQFVPSGWCSPYDGMSQAYEALGQQDGVLFASAMLRVCKGGGLDAAAPLRTILRSPFAADALLGLGLAAEHDGDTAQALKFYQQELAVDRTNVAALSAIARLGAQPAPQPIEE